MTNRNMPAEPLVSVVVPCFNAAAYVGETIESVLAQTYGHLELLVVDDGSSDRSPEIVQSYAERSGGRLLALRQPNGGLSNARNHGVARARGEYVFFLDADDLIAPDTLASLVAAANGKAAAIGVCGWRRLRQTETGWEPTPAELEIPAPDADHLRAWLEGQWIPICSLLWPRDLLLRLGGFDESLTTNEDGDLMWRALAEGARLVFAQAGESFYRTHGDQAVSMSRDMFSEHRYRSRVRTLEKLTVRLRELGLWERYREPVGIAYHNIALLGFEAHPVLARECLKLGERYAGKRAVSRTRLGRILVRLVGLERKERLIQTLAQLGLRTSERKLVLRHRQLHAGSAEPAAAERQLGA